MNKNVFLVPVFLLALSGCKPAGLTDVSDNAISVSGTRFVDSYGRQVIFNGINYVNKDPSVRYITKDSAVTFANFRNWGFNCIRLGIIWDGVEPEPGKYDEAYLDQVAEQVGRAASNGLYVLLDMHQDLYGVTFGEGKSSLGDGAPGWATLTDGQPHVKGFIWSDSYFLSPAVQRAFDNFWANKPVSDGIGVQDHYAKMWKHVASRFAGNKAVIGYDLMNEPFNGTPGTMILPVILTEYARLFAEETGKVLSEPELLGIWSNEEYRYEALARLEKIEKYARVISAATELSQDFEKNELHEMYQKVGNAIREVDTTHILFLEHAYFSNAGVSSGVLPLDDRNGRRDPLVAYAAHGYDLLVDTKNYDEQGTGRTAWIFSQIKSTSERTGMPVLVGEWGAFSGNSEGAAKSAVYIRELFDHYHFSHTYWAYHPGVENELYFRKTFIRPCPQLINGEPLGSVFSPETGGFRFSWRESAAITAPTVIYIPGIAGLDRESIRFSPGEGKAEILAMDSGSGGYLIIPASRKNLDRTLMFNLKSGH